MIRRGMRGALALLSGIFIAVSTPVSAQRGIPKEPVGVSRNGIFVAFPHDGSQIAALSTYVVGAIQPGSSLTLNGQAVRVNAQGFFAHVVPLSVGNNRITLQLNGAPEQSFELSVNRPAPPPPVPEDPPQISRSSIQPGQEIGLEPGDIVEFGMRASPGGQAAVRVGSVVIPLAAAGGRATAPKQGLDTTFGVTYQLNAATSKDLYTGFYRVSAADNWQTETPEFSLTKNGTTVHERANGRITVMSQPFLSSTAHDDTIVRVGPGAGRTTPLPAGVRVMVDGYVGDQYRCEMAPNKHFWIDKADLTGNEGPGTPPTAKVATINIENEGINGARIVVPLNQRLPFELKQEISSGNRVQLKLYGATADTDWITEPSTSSHAADEAVSQRRAYPPASERSHNPITYITWQQMGDRVYQATLNLNLRQQWGFWGEYQGTNLVVHIKGPPHVVPSSGSLRGLKICIDPGHGGAEPGSIGCSGIKEATLNLAIAQEVERFLQAKGAEVVMTRTGDTEVSLNDRVKIAADSNCNILLSIHNNSLPEGRNPWTEHGTSSYYYHPQALAFASDVRQGVVNSVHFPDYHTRWQNLALCRPSKQISALVEVGFMISPDEYALLLSKAGQQRAASGIVSGVQKFVYEALTGVPAKKKAAPSGKHSAKRHK